MAPTPSTRTDSAALHFHLWIGALNRVLRAAVAAQSARSRTIAAKGVGADCLAPAQADLMMAGLDQLNREGPTRLPEIALDRREQAAEKQIQAEAPGPLPLQVLRHYAGLTAFDLQALLVVAAAEISPDYARLYGFVLDDMTRGDPTIGAVLALTDSGAQQRPQRRALLGPGGVLRRLGLIEADSLLGDSLHTRLQLPPGLFGWLTGASLACPVSMRDPMLLVADSEAGMQPPASPAWKAASALLRRNLNACVGLWKTLSAHPDDAVLHLVSGAGLAAYSCPVSAEVPGWEARLRLAAARALGSGAALWIDCDSLLSHSRLNAEVALLLASLPGRLVLTGSTPWRPSELLAQRPYADVPDADAERIEPRWAALAGELVEETPQLAQARHRLGWLQRRAALGVARSEVRALRNGVTPPLEPALERSARMVASPLPGPSTRLVEPRRTLEDLILPPALHAQIAEIARFHAAADLVDRDWGFGRLAGSSGAVKVLFTGDPGTGKTLAAEVIAGLTGTALLKVDLSQVVSKWIGETEKNLEAVFDHAERSGATLFFDEADALFGKRGEVRHGTDRFANMEVSFLLQRLESFSRGLVILASNLRDEIDPAFSRRFQVSLHFPKPDHGERVRLWNLALAAAPVATSVRAEDLAALELTGGAIVGAARMAALLAASEGCEQLQEEHIVASIERQYRKEARLMTGTGRLSGLHVAQSRR